MSKTFLLKSLACAALVAACGASQATMTVFTSLTAFNAATSFSGTDGFTGFLITAPTASPIARMTQTGVSYSYTASAPGGFFGAGTLANPWLSTDERTDTITFSGWSSSISAVGGNFFGSDVSGGFSAGNVTVAATDASGTVTEIITGATTTSFLGFVSDGSITSLTITAVQPTVPNLWPTVDNLVLAVPEPGTYALFAAGLGVLGFMARRRRS